MRWNRTMLLLLGIVLVLALGSSVVAAAESVERGGGAKMSKTSVRDYKMIDINQIEMYVINDGTYGENPSTGGDGFFFPRGQRNLSIIYTGGMWFVGKVSGQYYSAASCYGSEYQPGAILADGTPDDPLAEKYIIYKYNKGDAVDQAAIDQGCPATVLGDQMLYMVYNDICDHSNVWGSPPIGLEVQHTIWAYNQSGALGNTIFSKFHFTNKGTVDVDSAFASVWCDPDVGDGNDDYVGCDQDNGFVYVYNGDNYDTKYGTEVPSLAIDFFQGPIVPATGETVTLPDGTVYPDSKMLGMTGMIVYINGAPVAGMNDPHTPVEAYYFSQGKTGVGAYWVNPHTGEESPFPFNGDPVTGTGWLCKDITVPKDMRMGAACGPFDLAVGQSQDVVAAFVVGRGSDNLASVSWMRFFDRIAQNTFDNNFNVPTSPPAPVVEMAQLDETLGFTWDTEAVDFSELGYEFEGYNIFQGASQSGPWTRIKTFDKVNGVTSIWDEQYLETIGSLVTVPVEFGEDNGLVFKFVVDRDYLNNIPLTNGKAYYFAFSSYAYNQTGVPKVLETAKVVKIGIPQKPVLDTELAAELGEAITPTHSTGQSQGVLSIVVTDPSAITGDNYQLGFYTITSGPDSGALGWKLTDTTLGQDVLVDQTYQGTDIAFTVNGFQFTISGPAMGIRDMVQVDADGNVLDSNVFRSLNYSADRTAGKCAWVCDVAGSDANTWKARLNWDNNIFTEDYEIRFVDDPATQGDMALSGWGAAPPYTMQGYQSGPVGATAVDGTYTPEFTNTGGRMPFQTWMIEADGTETHIVTLVLEDTEWGNWDLSGVALGPWSPLGFNYERLYGAKITYDEAAILADGGGDIADNQFFGGRPGNSAFSRLVISMYYDSYDSDPSGNFFTEPPAPGTIIRIRTNKPNADNDAFTFSTAAIKPKKNADVAKARLDEINVFPNPYFGHNQAESNFFTQFVTFNNLPETCTIRIFSLSGTLVTVLQHNDGTPFERWYLQNDEEISVASGMYIVHVETEFGNKILKLGVINRQAMYQHL